MDAFALLKYWRSGGGGSGAATIITTADTRAATETVADDDVSPYSSDGEDGPYFDLEFANRDGDERPPPKSPENPQETDSEDEETESGEEDDDDDEGAMKFSLASGECTDPGTAALSPSSDVFFRGDLVSIENSKLPIFLAKSATKFRVLLLKLKKSKPGNGESAEKNEDEGKSENSPTGKFTAVKYKVDEGPLHSLFTRDNSSKENGHGGKGQKGNFPEDSSVSESTTEERKLTKEMVQKYLKMVKPFYVRVSKRYVEKLRFPGQYPAPVGAARGTSKAHNLQSGLKVVRKHLGNSRSASAAVTAASNRRETSLPDGIEGAILHCKKSFNASSARDASESSSILCRSASDPSSEKSAVVPKTPSFCGGAKETQRI